MTTPKKAKRFFAASAALCLINLAAHLAVHSLGTAPASAQAAAQCQIRCTQHDFLGMPTGNTFIKCSPITDREQCWQSAKELTDGSKERLQCKGELIEGCDISKLVR